MRCLNIGSSGGTEVIAPLLKNIQLSMRRLIYCRYVITLLFLVLDIKPECYRY